MDNFLASSLKQFRDFKSLGDRTFSQLNDEQLFWQFNASSNSIAHIVKHLHGNMLSRWIDFLHSDGEKAGRNRDMEFENTDMSRQELLGLWERGWECLFWSPRSFEHTGSVKNNPYSGRGTYRSGSCPPPACTLSLSCGTNCLHRENVSGWTMGFFVYTEG